MEPRRPYPVRTDVIVGNDEPPSTPLTTAMFIDDLETKGPMYMRNLAEGRAALAVLVCTAA